MAHIKVTDSRDSGVNLEIRQTIFSGWLVSKILLIRKKFCLFSHYVTLYVRIMHIKNEHFFQFGQK